MEATSSSLVPPTNTKRLATQASRFSFCLRPFGTDDTDQKVGGWGSDQIREIRVISEQFSGQSDAARLSGVGVKGAAGVAPDLTLICRFL